MRKQARHRRLAAFLLQLLMIAGVLLNLLFSCRESIAIQWIRYKQQVKIRTLPSRKPACSVLYLSEKHFRQLDIIKGHECVIDGDFYEIVSMSRSPENVVLTLLPDPEESRMHKRLGQRLCSSNASRRFQKMPVPGFLFFEPWVILYNPHPAFEVHTLAGYQRFVPDRTMSIDLPPPRSPGFA